MIPINIIGKSIKTHRKRAGLTQQKLSGQICVHEITIRRWETGVREPRSSDIKALCEVLQVTEFELLNGPSDEKWELKIKIMNTREEVIEMMSGMPCISAISLTPEGGMFEVSGNKDVWRDSEKYEDLKRQMDKARETILEAGQKVWGV